MQNILLNPWQRIFLNRLAPRLSARPVNLKYNFLSFGRWIPYWDGGGGLLWTDLAPRIPEQSTQWNFILQTGPGLHYLVSEKVALTFSTRFSHISNANAGERNTGINAWMFNAGFSFFLP